MKQLIDAGNGVYIDPAEVSAILSEIQGRVCVMLRGASQPLFVRCESDDTAGALAQTLTARVNAVMAERHKGV